MSLWLSQDHLVPRKQLWAAEEAKTVEERRRRYRCRDRFVRLEQVPAWAAYHLALVSRQRAERQQRFAKLREAYERRKAQHDSKKQRLEEKKRRKALREEKKKTTTTTTTTTTRPTRQQQQQQKQISKEEEEEEEEGDNIEARRRRLEQAQEALHQRKALHESKQQRFEEKKKRFEEKKKRFEEKRRSHRDACGRAHQQTDARSTAATTGVPQPPSSPQDAEPGDGKAHESTTQVEQEKEKKEQQQQQQEEEEEEEEEELSSSSSSSSSEESELSSTEEEPADVSSEMEQSPPCAYFAPDEELNSLLSLWQGDITRLEIDAIVNAANRCARVFPVRVC